MKKLQVAAAIIATSALVGCATNNEYSSLLDARKFAHEVTKLDIDQLEAFNTEISFSYLGMADLATRANHISNATLIGIAAMVAKGHIGGGAGVLEDQRLLYGLVISETARYAAPNEVARALRIAGQQSACIAKTISQEGDSKTKGKETEVLSVMQRVRSNLHERMTKREPVNVVSLISSFKGETEVLREDNIQLDNALAEAKAKANSLEKTLLQCLKLAG